MRFGRRPLADAAGAILAHGLAGLKKGHVLTPPDIARLRDAGISEAMVAILEDGDIHEDDAARSLATALAGQGISADAPHTGRSNLRATASGLVLFDEATIHRINRLHESLTVATLRPFEHVAAGQMLATVKIIPFASPDWAVAAAAEIARAAPLRLAPFTPRTVALVSTTLPGMKASLLDKTRAVLDRRLAALQGRIVAEDRVPHDESHVEAALRAAQVHDPDLILAMGASATTDREDTLPAAVVAAGGEIEHVGMPVDPGNLLFVGHLGRATVIGVPGCARSPKLNGLDFVLQRLAAGLPVDRAAIQAMGVGGLLQEITTRPQQREATPTPQGRPRVAAILLAAGRSTRMGGRNKLLLDLAGAPVVTHVARALANAQVAETLVVTGHDRDEVEAALAGLPVAFTHNPDFATGMAGSLKAGLAALGKEIDGVLVCLGDMPAVATRDINRLIAAFDPAAGRAIVVPVFGGKRGNPVLLDRRFIPDIMKCEGDTGARPVVAANPDAVFEVEMEGAGVLADADTPAAFSALEAEFQSDE